MNPRTFHFGPFNVEAATRTLLRGDHPLALPPKAFDCLLYLLQHRERAVGRDELIAAVWGKTDVSDGVLGQTILLIRRALDDTGKEQRYIRTVPRFGYHWLAPVTMQDALTAASNVAPVAVAVTRPQIVAPRAAPSESPEKSPYRLLQHWIGAALFAAAVACGGTALLWMSSQPSWNRGRSQGSIAVGRVAAVLPVVINDKDAAWMRLGLMDFIATRLRERGQAVVPSDNVIALTRAYERDSVDPAQLDALAAATNAELVIDAHAESLLGRWRVTLRTSRGHLPALAAVGEADDALAAAREATDRMATALGLNPTTADARADTTPRDSLRQQIAAALLGEQLELARTLLDNATPEQRARPENRFFAGQIQFQAGRFDAAEASFRALCDSVPATQDAVLHARALNAIGAIALQRQQPAAALPNLNRAIDLLGNAQAFDELGTAYSNRATAYGSLRNYDAARADLAHARNALESADDNLGVAVVNSNAGTMAMNRDRFAEAAPVLTFAADRFASFGAFAAELNARSNAAEAHLALLDPSAAMAEEQRLRELDGKVSDPERRRRARLARIETLFANGLDREAYSLLGEVRAEAEREGASVAVARTQSIAARQELREGATIAAERDAIATLKIPPEPQDPRATGIDWLTLMRAQRAQEDDVGAAESLDAAVRWASTDGSASAELQVALARAEHDAAKTDPGTERAFEEALTLAERDRVPTDLLAVSQAYVIWLLQQDKLARASAVAERRRRLGRARLRCLVAAGTSGPRAEKSSRVACGTRQSARARRRTQHPRRTFRAALKRLAKSARTERTRASFTVNQ